MFGTCDERIIPYFGAAWVLRGFQGGLLSYLWYLSFCLFIWRKLQLLTPFEVSSGLWRVDPSRRCGLFRWWEERPPKSRLDARVRSNRRNQNSCRSVLQRHRIMCRHTRTGSKRRSLLGWYHKKKKRSNPILNVVKKNSQTHITYSGVVLAYHRHAQLRVFRLKVLLEISSPHLNIKKEGKKKLSKFMDPKPIVLQAHGS